MHIATLLRCYPPAWRDRYATEMTELLEEHEVTFATWLDLLRGALDARLDPAFAAGRGRMVTRLRRSEIVVFFSFIVYVVAGIGFQKMTEDADKAGVMRTHVAVGIGYYAVIAGAVIAMLAVAAGGLPLGLSVLRQALAGRRRDLLGLLALPLVLFVVLIGWGADLARSHETINSSPVRGLVIYVMVAAVASAASVSLAVSRADPSEATLRFARIPALVASLAMGLSLIGVAAWGLSLRSLAPSFFTLDGGALQSYPSFTWMRVVVVMSLATAAAFAAIWRLAGTPSSQHPA